MRQIFKIAFDKHKNSSLIVLIISAMILLTFASQLEILALGIITKKGPDFFELFAPLKEGKLEKVDQISSGQVQARFQEIDTQHTGFITPQEVDQFLLQTKNRDIIGQVTGWINKILPIKENLSSLAIFLVFVAIFKAITLFAHRFSTRVMAIRISRDLRQKYFEHIQTLPMKFYQDHNIGSLSSRVMGDSAMIAEAINACLVNYLQTPFTVITTLLLCFYTSWKLSLIIFIGFPLIVFPIVFLAKRVKRISKQIQQNQERFASVIIDFLAGIQTVKLFGMEEFSLNKYRDQNHKMAALEQKSARYDLSSRPIIHTIGMFFLATALIYGLYVLQMSVPEILFYCGLLYVFYEPIKKFAEENSHIQRGIAAAERMCEVLELRPTIVDSDGAETMTQLNDSIEFDNVWFRYGEDWVLKGLSFKVEKGKTVAIVGPTGAGKSTIVQLLPRLYDIQQGTIRINGKPIHTYTQKSLRNNIAFVPQKPFLFLDTVSENISYGQNLSNEQIQLAARKAFAEEFILQLPQGYKTELSETGKNLSGGQQQRLAIARALAKNAPILIMDEATSSLDTISEVHIKNAIHELRGQVTQIIIAHRLSTIEDADKIIYLEKGEKIAEGTKEELLKSCQGFKKMWDHMLHSTSK
ncbi:MAG: ABC transporter ATP-binding protein [Chlamydiales bacterium 38-26]|nr:ABC transporter ATP-binding protein [Chlamydiales bacterium]OJV09316.1 MAG: ABC transporter ATP-binding protein [Chlamydiales bacterium 38-26]